jgi:hypothetical protein
MASLTWVVVPLQARALLLKLPLAQYTALLVDYRMYLLALGTFVWLLSNVLLARRARLPG